MTAFARSPASHHLLLVEFSPEDVSAFRWLEQGLPYLHIEDCSLMRAYRRIEQRAYDMVFIDIPRGPTATELGLVRDLAQLLQNRRPSPVMVPMVDSGDQLGKGGSVLVQVCPDYLTRPLNLQDLLQVVQTFAGQKRPRNAPAPLSTSTNGYT